MLCLPVQLLTWILGVFSHNLPQCFYVHCTAAAVQFLQTWTFSWVASQAPSISMRVGQLLDFILLHILKIFGCVNLGFFAKIWLFDILYILNRCFFEPLIPLHEILQFVCNTHHSSFWHNSLCFISSHSSEIDLQLPDLTPSEHTSYPDRGRKWSDRLQYMVFFINNVDFLLDRVKLKQKTFSITINSNLKSFI